MQNKPTYQELLEENKKLKKIIAENKSMIESYAKEKIYLDALLENIPNAIYFKDINSKFVKTSNSIARDFGLTEVSELIGKSDFDFFENESASKYFNSEQEIIKTGKPIYNNLIIEKRKNGKKTWAIISKIPLRDKNNKIIGTFGISSDITDRKEAEEIIKKNEIQLKELNATKDKFFSIIAHDLKGPIGTMVNFSELLIKNFEKYDIAKQKKIINIVYEGIQNTNKLLNNLLTWSRSQRGTLKFNPKRENLLTLTHETIKLLKYSAENKSIKLLNNINNNIYVNADKDMLSIVIRNLISNAIKFTYKNGEVGISVVEQLNDNKQIEVIVTVSDNGIGIPLKIQEKLFSISESTSTQGTENETGTGLGLIICKEFINKHGGKIWVESEKNKGSKFKFTLPSSND